MTTNDSTEKVGMKDFELLKVLGTGGKIYKLFNFLLLNLKTFLKIILFKLMGKFFWYVKRVVKIMVNYML